MSFVLPFLPALMFAILPAPSGQWSVNSTLDLPDATPLGDGVVDADPTLPGDQITLRAAIMESNAMPGANYLIVPPGTYRLELGHLHIHDELQIEGDNGIAGDVIIDAEKAEARAFFVEATTLSLGFVTVRNGSCVGDGGGILAQDATLYLYESIVEKCRATGSGGGVKGNNSAYWVSRVVFRKNEAKESGGGIAFYAGQSLGLVESQFIQNKAKLDGGGVHLKAPPTPVALLRCTFSKNTAGRDGGGLAVWAGSTLMSNCTFDRNKAVAHGGGVSYAGGGDHTWLSGTLARNKAPAGSGIHEDLTQVGVTTITVVNTILANGKKTNYSGDGITSFGHNIDTGKSCGFTGPGDLQNTDPRLAKKLKDNGGPTPTIALKPDSPAIDAADDTQAPPTDQRLLNRVAQLGPGTSLADIGAFEVQ